MGAKAWPACKATNLTAICEATPHNRMGLQGLLQRQLYILTIMFHTQLKYFLLRHIKHIIK
jgi:hypothetical protein